MKPEEVGYITELDSEYTAAIKEIHDHASFEAHLKRFEYWLDEDIKKMTGPDWDWLASLVKDCQTQGVEPEDKHSPAISLLMPERIFRVSMEAVRFKVPWGCAYIRLKEEKLIKY